MPDKCAPTTAIAISPTCGARPGPAQVDLARDGMHGVRRRGDEFLRREIALGDPRAFVKEPRGFVERLDIDLDDGRTERHKARDRGFELRGGNLIAEEH